MSQSVTHSRWLKGLQAGFDRYSLPKGSVSRISNMVYTRRGALKVCDGSLEFAKYNGVFQPISANFGPITEVYLFQPVGSAAAYFGIVKDVNTHLTSPAGVMAVDAGGGGNLSAGSYKWTVTALDGAGGETPGTSQASLTLLANHKATITWSSVTNATGYNIYRTVANGLTFLLVGTVGQVLTFSDNVADVNLGTQQPPIANNTQVCQFYTFTSPSYGAAQIIKTLPADSLIFLSGVPGSYGGSHGPGSGSSGLQPPTPIGGLLGNLSPLPQIVGFVNKMMLALGNGITPYQSDGTGGGTTQLTNTFSATYPVWTASTAWLQGSQIQVNISSVLYVFTAVQGGTSGGGGAPAFSATLGSTVADNNIIWKNSGQVSASPPPRGAGHAEVYAGSLWVANTGIVLSADQLDGPSALRMSDLNNPISWNPLNAAQISPDDGDQCSGIKAFTVAEAGIAPQNFLMFFKNYSSYLIQGVFGASNFAITRLQTDMGCVAPRTIQFVPGFGIMRLSHLGFAVTDGITDKLQSPEAIRPYLFPESTESDITAIDQSFLYFSKAAQTSNPPMYVCACPLLAANLVFNHVIGASSYSTTCSLSPGSYYFRLQYILGNGTTYLTPESGPVAIDASHGALITFPPNGNVQPPAGTVTARVFYGIGSGNENQYMDFIPGTTLGVISAAGTAGSPGSVNDGHLSRLFCFDLVLKSWTVVDMPFSISVLKQFRTPGSAPITAMAGFYDGALRRWQAGDVNWDGGAVNAGADNNLVDWSFRDADVYDEAGTVRVFHNQVIIKGDGGPSSISVTPAIDGDIEPLINASLIALSGGQYEARVRIMETAEDLNLTVSGSGPATVESIDYQVVPKPAGAALVFS